MKDLYVITIELDEKSIYFAELTVEEAVKMRRALLMSGFETSIHKVRESDGFNSFGDVMKLIHDLSV